MKYQFYMPTKIVSGRECIVKNSELLKPYGKKAMIVTGRHSAKANGSLADVQTALEGENIEFVVFDQVMSNPTVDIAYEGAAFAKKNGVEFIIAIGGGSPIDAAKTMAILAKQEIRQEDLFKGGYGRQVLPIVTVPTTAGTGSEVTPYAILTNDRVESKTSVATPLIFPQIAYVDPRYMSKLNAKITINTAVDALSHAVEGILNNRSSVVSEAIAMESVGLFTACVPALTGKCEMDESVRAKLSQCSTLAGMVIAQTGTTVVHAMGYSLTYFKHIAHGRANGLLLGSYLRLVEKEKPQLVSKVLGAMNMNCVDQFDALMDDLFGEREAMSEEEMLLFAGKAAQTGNMANCIVRPTEEQIVTMYKESF